MRSVGEPQRSAGFEVPAVAALKRGLCTPRRVKQIVINILPEPKAER